jgi:hypothetical protein
MLAAGGTCGCSNTCQNSLNIRVAPAVGQLNGWWKDGQGVSTYEYITTPLCAQQIISKTCDKLL